jgi:hypothetical protein
MAVPNMRGSRPLAAMALMIAASAFSIQADEIRLKDGKKLNGVIVAYEDNMFKVKTDFGYVLVEKDKIASIIPSTPAKGKSDSQPAAKKDGAPTTKSPSDAQPSLEPASATSIEPAPATRREKAPAKLDVSAVKPDAPTNAPATAAGAPKIKSTTTPPSGLSTAAATPAPPKEPEVPANREEIQGNLYTNYTHGFRMYKAPSWNPIEEARNALPNAIMAMGTLNQSTMLVIGQEKTKESLPVAATTVEKRLREVYENYRQISQRKTVVGGLPGIEYRYRGVADDHDWSGTLVVISRGNDIFTVLGMTYADTDLIQIQENVISRSISSLDFNVH